ncbi:hypothetical protein LSUE1_G001301 [Lachnellula suecica]|uniref:Paxilline synthesis protein A n=1 Tax=Lachnellula suecica TaxID=602035 RepID=A0A8T9CI43_9HELO|nr:hypothetical protein LSUE1_G001301 [Lachnellula suecica]
MSGNPKTQVVKEKKWVRALYALPILAAVYGAQKTMGVTVEIMTPMLQTAVKEGKIDSGNGVVAPLHKQFFGVKGLDDFMAIFVAFFTPILGNFDPASGKQGMAFGGDLIALQTIWLVEGIRRGNHTTVAHLLLIMSSPTILGLLFQVKGLGFIAPIWFFFHYVQSPLENYQAADERLTQVGPAKTLIPTIVLSYLLPTIAMTSVSGLENRQWINGLFWQLFPLSAAIYQRVFGLLVKDTTEVDRIANPEADLPYLRRAYRFAGITAAALNIYARYSSPASLMAVFFQGISTPSAVSNILEGAAKFLRYDQIATFGAGTIWTMLSFWDLKKTGKVQAGWLKVLGIYGATTFVAGPGAAMMALWAWREEVLAARKKVAAKNN